MKILSLVVILAFQGSVAHADWEKIHEKSEVTVYRDQIEGSKLLAFKGEGIVKAPFARVASVMFDTARAREWVDDLEETRIVKWLTENEFLEYDHMRAPPLISDRDFFSKVEMAFNVDKSEFVFIMHNIPESDTPTEFKKSAGVRGSLDGTRYLLAPAENGKSTFVVGEVHADPKGSLPIWIVNFFQKNWPVDTIVNLRKQVAKEDIKLDSKITSLLKAHLKLTPEELCEPAH